MNYLIINFYSPLNAGDLAILEQTVKLIRLADGQARIEVCVSDTKLLTKIEGATWLRSWNWVVTGPGRMETLRRLRQAYTGADVIVSVGGGYFFVHDQRPVSTYATLSLLVALLTRKPVLCFPQSFGPFRHHYQARLAAWLLRGARGLLIREEQSMALLHQTDQALAARAVLVPDTALTLALEIGSHARQASSGSRQARQERPNIGITLLDWASVNPLLKAQSTYEHSMAALIVHAWKKLGARITLFVQCRSARRDFESDLSTTRRVADLATGMEPGIKADITVQADLIAPADYVRAYGEMDYFIGTRMHSLIFAACAGVPIIAVGYQHKSLGLMKMLGLEQYHTDMSQLTPDQLIRCFESGWAQREGIEAQLRQQVSALGQASRQAMLHVLAQTRAGVSAGQ